MKKSVTPLSNDDLSKVTGGKVNYHEFSDISGKSTGVCKNYEPKSANREPSCSNCTHNGVLDENYNPVYCIQVFRQVN